jgi:GntR family transcriptional regulator/MocR family aminotransferase
VPEEWATFGTDLHLSISRPGVRVSLERALRTAVQDGRLRPGVRLPSSRSLASDLNVARNTVAEVYAQLAAEGWLTARRGSGTAVSAQVATSDGPAPEIPPYEQESLLPYDLRPGTPNVLAFPRGAWLSAARAALTNAPPDAFGYDHILGRPELRHALAEYLGRVRAVRTTPDRIVIAAGTVHSLSMLCTALKRRGASTIAFEAYGWHALVAAARMQGLRTVTINVDSAGARVDELYATNADAVVLTPAHQFPTGYALSAERRRAVAQWARATGGLIIEDDYDGEFRYDRQPVGALQELAPDRVAYLGTTSKSLAPGLRLAWAVLPADLVESVRKVKRATVWSSDAVQQLTLNEFIRSGAYDRHVRRSRLVYRRRRDRLVLARDHRAPDVPFTGTPAGLHVVMTLPDRLAAHTDDELCDLAASRGLAVHGLTTYRIAAGRDDHPSLVVGYGTPADHAFEPALDILFGLLAPR